VPPSPTVLLSSPTRVTTVSSSACESRRLFFFVGTGTDISSSIILFFNGWSVFVNINGNFNVADFLTSYIPMYVPPRRRLIETETDVRTLQLPRSPHVLRIQVDSEVSDAHRRRDGLLLWLARRGGGGGGCTRWIRSEGVGRHYVSASMIVWFHRVLCKGKPRTLRRTASERGVVRENKRGSSRFDVNEEQGSARGTLRTNKCTTSSLTRIGTARGGA
jgi:hypothetical protein